LVEAQRLEERTRFDCEMMVELGYCTGIENYSRYLSGRAPGQPPPTLMDYLPEHALLFIDESHVTLPQLRGMYHGDQSRKHNLVHYGFRLPSAKDNRPLQFEEFLRIAPQTIFVSATPGQYEKEESGQIVPLDIRPTGLLDPMVTVRPAVTQVEDALSEITKAVAQNERILITTLTKKMAEYLSDYFTDHGVKCRYLHSDIDTVERVEILRDLRLGTFDALIGINLLREGLDLPEVAIVMIFDADKMGFLRSESALIQTIGRAARHLSGRAILYAEQMTDAMKGAIEQTVARRALQDAYNKAEGLVPRTIIKANDHGLGIPVKIEEQVVQKDSTVLKMTPKAFAAHIEKLETVMLDHAEALEFERSAHIRDEIANLKRQYLEGYGVDEW
jgi:excinuclease ABC subunit B